MEFPQAFGSYVIVRRIAIGGMAEIYLAKAAGLAGFEKHLVLKVIHPKYATDPEFIEMLVREAKLVVRLAHVNIAQVFDLGREGDRYYIAMEFVDGLDLYQLLRKLREKRAPMPLEVAAYIVSEVASGLNYAHKRKDELGTHLGIIHRDISPQNILLSQAGDVKIIDFGIAKARAYAQTTAVGIIKGKFSYMSPEQAQGEVLDHRSDIFTVGVLFYELLTGRMLYDSDGARDALRLAKAARFLPPSTHRDDLPRDLEKVVLKALARDREARYQTGDELREALTTWLRNRAPGYGRHRLEQFIGETCGGGKDGNVSVLGRGEYEPQASVIFSREKEEERAERENHATRQIDPRKRGRQSPPPIPNDSLQQPTPKAERAIDQATLHGGDKGERVFEATSEQENFDDPEQYEATVDLFSAPTAIVHLPSVPTIDVYTGSDETSNPGIFSRKSRGPADPTLDAGLSTAKQAYADTREAMSKRRHGVQTELGSSEGELELEERPPPADTPPSPLQAAWSVGPGVPGANRPSRDVPPSVVNPPKVTKVPPPSYVTSSPEEAAETTGASNVYAAKPSLRLSPSRLSPSRPSQQGARLKLMLLVLMVIAAMTVGVMVLILALRAPPANVASGAVHVTTTPALGAEIILDGRPVGGLTPARISGLEGNSVHEIRVRHPDYGEGVAEGVRIVSGGEVELTIELIPPREQ